MITNKEKRRRENMFYPYTRKQTTKQYLLNTIDPRMWHLNKDENDCECCWQYFQGKLMWIPLGGCTWHD